MSLPPIYDNINVNVPKNIDNSKGIYPPALTPPQTGPWRPYLTTAEVLSAVDIAYRYEGQMFPVKPIGETNIQLWQFVGGVTDTDLTFVVNVMYTNDVFDDLNPFNPIISNKGTAPVFKCSGANNGISVTPWLINNWTGELETYMQVYEKPNNGGAFDFATDIKPGYGIYRVKDRKYYVKQFNGAIDARWFKLQDTATNCDVVISEALYAAAGIKAGVYVPAGKYQLSNAINLVNNSRLIGASNAGINDPLSTTGTYGTVFTPAAGSSGVPLSAASVSNIYIENVNFSGCGNFDLNNCKNVTLSNIKIANATGNGIYLKSGSNLTVDGCTVDTATGMGICVEIGSTTTMHCKNISITNCTVSNTADNGIATRIYQPGASGIGYSIFDVDISGNKVNNAGKGGIRCSVEKPTPPSPEIPPTCQFNNIRIINNIINGWGKTASDTGITIASLTSGITMENGIIENNLIQSDSGISVNNQNTYIRAARLSRGIITGNIGANGCGTNGITVNLCDNSTVNTNVIELACQNPAASTAASSNGGIVINTVQNSTVANNIIKNTGSFVNDTTTNTNKITGLFVIQAIYGSYTGNLIYDSRDRFGVSGAVSPYKAQFYGIQESQSAGTTTPSANNIYTGNISYGNYNTPQNYYSFRSQSYEGNYILASNTSYTLTQATPLLILPVITANRTLTLYTPGTGAFVNTSMIIYNSNNNAFTQTLSATTPVVDPYGNTITILQPGAVYQIKWTGNSWLMTSLENATTTDIQTGTNNTRYVSSAELAAFWTYIKLQPQTLSALWTHAALLKYGADYSSSYDSRTLIDKGYADSKYAPKIDGAALTGSPDYNALNSAYPSSTAGTVVTAPGIQKLFIKKSTGYWASFAGTVI